jgi:F420-non-reducing hydrogenase iron-sulfur subunit
MCSGRTDPDFILEAFRLGADGVLVLGCPPGNCHYKNGNIETLKRITLLKKVLGHYGVDAERLVLDWISAGEGEKFVSVVKAMIAKVKLLGPL